MTLLNCTELRTIKIPGYNLTPLEEISKGDWNEDKSYDHEVPRLLRASPYNASAIIGTPDNQRVDLMRLDTGYNLIGTSYYYAVVGGDDLCKASGECSFIVARDSINLEETLDEQLEAVRDALEARESFYTVTTEASFKSGEVIYSLARRGEMTV